MNNLQAILQQVLGVVPQQLESLSGGLSAVYRVLLPNGDSVVAKTGRALETEAYMLHYLSEHSTLPVPKVIHATDSLLIMSHVEGGSALGSQAEHHAAELVAALHNISAPQFGLERETIIGNLAQPNLLTEQWLPFFRDHRLLYMAREAAKSGRLPGTVLARIERLAERLDHWLTEPSAPSLLHGDIWSGNVLAHGGRIAAFIDPAIYYGHREIELAFITLFNTFGDDFFQRYHELSPVEAGFFEERRDLYNLYPLLVHVRIFGGGYVHAVERTLQRYGY